MCKLSFLVPFHARLDSWPGCFLNVESAETQKMLAQLLLIQAIQYSVFKISV